MGRGACFKLAIFNSFVPLGKFHVTVSPVAYPITAEPMGARMDILLAAMSRSVGITN